MANPASITSSAGGDWTGANVHGYTRFKGIRVGTMTTGSSTIIDPHGSAGGPGGGTATLPVYSFVGRPDMGMYAKTITTSAGGVAEMRYAVSGFDQVAITTYGLYNVSTSGATAGGMMSTTPITALTYIPQTSASLSSATAPVLPSTYVVPLFWDGIGKQLWIYSSNSGWVGIGPTTSGGNLWVTTSGA